MSERYCAICKNTAGNTRVTLFRVPINKKRMLWQAKCKVPLTNSSSLCEKHFDRKAFLNPPGKKSRACLMPNAIPTLLLSSPVTATTSQAAPPILEAIPAAPVPDLKTISPNVSTRAWHTPVDSTTPNVKVATPTPNVKAANPTPYVNAATPTPNVKAATPTPHVKAAAPTPHVKVVTLTPNVKASAPTPNVKAATPTQNDENIEFIDVKQILQAPFVEEETTSENNTLEIESIKVEKDQTLESRCTQTECVPVQELPNILDLMKKVKQLQTEINKAEKALQAFENLKQNLSTTYTTAQIQKLCQRNSPGLVMSILKKEHDFPTENLYLKY